MSLDLERFYPKEQDILSDWSFCEVCGHPVNEHEWVDLDTEGFVTRCSKVNAK